MLPIDAFRETPEDIELGRAVDYAKERLVFDRPIGQERAVARPLAMGVGQAGAGRAHVSEGGLGEHVLHLPKSY